MKKILVIEDESGIRENIQEILEFEGFEVIAAENGLIGLEKAKEYLPDLIICDVMMPKLDGYGVLQALQADPLTISIPFIFVTAKADRLNLRQGMNLGADDYLSKPFIAEELVQAIVIRLNKQAIITTANDRKMDSLRNSISTALPHELLTPLNGILGLSSILIDDFDNFTPGEVVDSLQDIHNSGKRLHRIIQNYLLFAKLELISNSPEKLKYRQSMESTSAQVLITSVVKETAHQLQRETDLKLEIEPAEIAISGQDLKKVIVEIVENAFKFSAVGTEVILIGKILVDSNFYQLQVIDRGRGMTTEQIEQVGAYMQFERKFYEQQGSGMGLAIARKIVELYGGKLTIESIPKQKTCINVSLNLLAS